ncbi:MAG: HAD-IB family hydrolase [Gammaproteobacteria bacterium]
MKLAVFDLDGTITRHDTLIQFTLGYLKSRPWRLFGFVLSVPAVLLYLLRRTDRGALKGSVIRWTLGGSSRGDLDAWTATFVPRVLERGAFKAALERIAEHKRNGDILVLMSASPDLYVPAIARHLGFNEVTCTGVRWNGNRLEGRLTTENCRGAEKVRRFAEIRGRYPNLATAAYGNADSDIDHLRLADRGVLVNGDDRARRRAAGLGVVCENWA